MADGTAIAARLAQYPRAHGYYLLRFRDITPLRASGLDEEAICELVFQEFDDEPWPPPDERPREAAWADHRVERDVARRQLIDGLAGGRKIGNTADTIPRDIAAAIVDELETLFDEPRHYYAGLGLGDHEYVFSNGCAIVGAASAGCLIVVEDD